MHLAARVRWTLARHPSLYWLLIGACASFAAVTVHGASREAAAARHRWGTAVDVVVADTDIGRGDPLAVSLRRLPLAALPDGALTAVPAAGTVAARRIAAGAILTEHDLAVLDRVPDGWVTLALPALAPAVVEGDQVAVLGSGTVLCDGIVAGPPNADWVDVAVPASCAGRASAAAALGEVMLGRRA